MTTTVASVLARAARSFGQCAKAVETKRVPSGLTLVEYERLIGFGIASDWFGVGSTSKIPQLLKQEAFRVG